VSRKLHFGLIGLGEIAYKSTGKLLQKTARAEALAGVDPRPDIASSYQATYGIPCSTSLDDVLHNPDVDAVIVSTPHYLHVPLGIAAAEAGKHVIVEKPMATTLADADALIAACERCGVLCSSKECGVRNQPATARARDLIAQGAIGDVMATQVYGASNKPDSYWTGGYTGRVQTTWRISKAESGGGILLMNYIYDIDRLRYCTGLEISRVFAEYDTFQTPVEVEDFISVTLRYSNHALGTILASSCVPGAGTRGVRGTRAAGNRIYGTAGQIVFDEGNLLVYSDHDLPGLARGDWTEFDFSDAPREQPYVTYLDRFAEAVLDGGALEAPAEEGRRNLEVILAAYRSGELHGPVDLPMEAV
jgi:predicted dehydrogenase